MAGWFFGIDSLTRILPQGINMAFPTAVMFFMSSIGLYFIYRTTIENDYSLSPIILSGTALIIFLINITILIGSITGAQTGMENLFIQRQYYENINSAVAQAPSVPTIISFIIFGIANIYSLFSSPKHIRKIKSFGYPIILFGLMAVAGYIFGLPFLYYKFTNSSIPMALNTAIAFILLGFGLVAINMTKKNNEA